jgi:hypothetical protein
LVKITRTSASAFIGRNTAADSQYHFFIFNSVFHHGKWFTISSKDPSSRKNEADRASGGFTPSEYGLF